MCREPRPPPVSPTALEWSLLLAGLLFVLHYLWLMDDAFVYFRYVDNLLFLDLGLVYNAGEYVEGYSSPLWVILLSAARSTELDWTTLVEFLAAGHFVLFWWLLVRLSVECTPAGRPRLNLPLVLLASCYAVQSSFSSGTESPSVQVMAVAFALFARRPDRFPRELAVAIAPLVRNELALLAVLAVVWSWITLRRFPLRLVSWIALFGGGWMLFRITYYSDVVPSTFHLKDTLLPRQGLLYLWDTASTYQWPAWLGLGVLFVLVARLRGRDARLRLRSFLLLCSLLYTAYVVKIGGDARHFRYLAFPFCLSICALSGLPIVALAAAPRETPSPTTLRRQRLRWSLAGVLLAVLMASRSPLHLEHHPLWRPNHHTPQNGNNDAEFHRAGLRLRYGRWAAQTTPDLQRRAREREGDALHARFVVENVCLKNYTSFRDGVVHSLGLTDPVLASCEVPVVWSGHRLDLIPLAKDLATLRNTAKAQAPGMFREAVQSGSAPPWIAENLAILERIERRMFNEHHFLDNLVEALTPLPRISLPDPPLPDRPASEAVGPAAERG